MTDVVNNQPVSLIHIEGLDVMLGGLKKPIGRIMKNPFRVGGLMFEPSHETLMSQETLRAIADEMDHLGSGK